MADIRLRGVHGFAVVPHILRAVEGAEGQPIQEIPWVQEARHWPNLPSCRIPAKCALPSVMGNYGCGFIHANMGVLCCIPPQVP